MRLPLDLGSVLRGERNQPDDVEDSWIAFLRGIFSLLVSIYKITPHADREPDLRHVVRVQPDAIGIS